MSRTLVTGGTGFVGRHLVRALATTGTEVYRLVRRPDSVAPEAGVVDVGCDLFETADVRAAVASVRPDAAYHLAWYVEPGRWKDDSSRQLASLEAGVRLVGALLDSGCWRIVLAGSGVEDHLPHSTTYAAAKAALHTVGASLVDRAGASVVCAHLFSVFGPGEDPRRLVPTVATSLLRGVPVDVTDGLQKRDYLHVTDVASALVTVGTSHLIGTVDIAARPPRPQRDLVLAVAAETGRPDLLRLGGRPYPSDELPVYAGDPTVLAATGWRPVLDEVEAVRSAVDYWRAQTR